MGQKFVRVTKSEHIKKQAKQAAAVPLKQAQVGHRAMSEKPILLQKSKIERP
jgi:hypothetical protein